MEKKVIIGSDRKFDVKIDPFVSVVEDTEKGGGATKEVELHISDESVNFKLRFYVNSKEVVLEKSELSKIDDDTYRASFNTGELTAGDVMVEATIDIPDGDFSDGTRTEIVRLTTDVKLIR